LEATSQLLSSQTQSISLIETQAGLLAKEWSREDEEESPYDTIEDPTFYVREDHCPPPIEQPNPIIARGCEEVDYEVVRDES
jgi:hypothetical protein